MSDPDLMPPVRLRDSDSQYALGVWANVVIVVFAATPGAAAAARMKAAADDAAREHPEGIAMLHVVDARRGPPPGQAARAQYLEMIRAHDEHFVAAAIVATGTGFVPSMVRSVAAGFALVTRPKFPMKTFPTVDDAVRWLAERASKRPDDLRDAYDRTRAAIGHAPQPPK